MRALRFFWQYISHRPDLLAIVLVVSGLLTIAELFIPWILMNAIDAVVVDKDVARLNTFGISALALIAAYYVINLIQIRFEAHLILESSYNLSRRLFEHIISRDLGFFEKYKTGEMLHRVVTDTDNFEESVEDLISEFPFDVLTIIGVTIFMAVLDVQLAAIIVIFMLINVGLAWYMGRPLLRIEKAVQSIGATLTARLQESITGIRTVKGFTNEGYELDKLNRYNRQIVETELKENRIESFMEPAAEAFTLLGLVLVIWYGGVQIAEGTLSVGALVAFIAYMEILSESLEEMEGYYRDYLASKAMAERLQDVFDEDKTTTTSGTLTFDSSDVGIEFENVSFRYPSKRSSLLSNMSFDVPSGTALAIVGKNGAGKSSILSLLQRMHEPTEGSIKVNGQNILEFDVSSWRRNIGVLSQETFLFHGTIWSNVAYGDLDADKRKIEQAITDAGLDEMVARFPQGLETIVGERGAALSGGERQLIALARLFVRDPKLVLLDEPTTYLDGRTLEKAIQKLREFAAERTTILVTHRAELAEIADSVIFLHGGSVVARGDHEELLETTPTYRSFWKKQASDAKRSTSRRHRFATRAPAEAAK